MSTNNEDRATSASNEGLKPIVVKLDELIALVKACSGKPNLDCQSIINSIDFELAGQIYDDAARDSLNSAGL